MDCRRAPALRVRRRLQPDEHLLVELYSASVHDRAAIGEKSGASVERLGRRREVRPLFLPEEFCCVIDSFSLHAKVEIEAHDRD